MNEPILQIHMLAIVNLCFMVIACCAFSAFFKALSPAGRAVFIILIAYLAACFVALKWGM